MMKISMIRMMAKAIHELKTNKYLLRAHLSIIEEKCVSHMNKKARIIHLFNKVKLVQQFQDMQLILMIKLSSKSKGYQFLKDREDIMALKCSITKRGQEQKIKIDYQDQKFQKNKKNKGKQITNNLQKDFKLWDPLLTTKRNEFFIISIILIYCLILSFQ